MDSYRGVPQANDSRFSNKEARLLKTTKFPEIFKAKVDIRKVKVDVMRPWVAEATVAILGFEDDIVVEYVQGMLEDREQPFPDPRKMQVYLTGFLEARTAGFMEQLWTHLLSAQANPSGISQQMLDKRKAEIVEQSAQAQSRSDAHAERLAQDRAQDAHMQDVRQRERQARMAHRPRYERSRSRTPPPPPRSDRRRPFEGRDDGRRYRDRSGSPRRDRIRHRSRSASRDRYRDRSHSRDRRPSSGRYRNDDVSGARFARYSQTLS